METKLSNIKIQIRRDTQANWLSADPILLNGELGIVTDQAQLKVGDGVTKFSLLPAYNLETGGGSGGAAETAEKLATPRTINIAGDATGSTQFDGSQNVTITLDVANSATADKLSTTREISISGDATGSTEFDGSGNANIVVMVAHADQADNATNATTATNASHATSADTATSASSATKLKTARSITLTGDATGTVDFDGTDDVSITVDVNHATSADKATNATNATKATTATSATSATKLATARSITLTGDATGSTSFDGSGNVSIATTIANMEGATSSSAGADGFVPAPAAGAQGKFLRGDGTWQTPANTDTKVTQTVTTTNAEYPLLAASLAKATANRTEGVRFASAVTLNPSTQRITAKGIKAPANGTTYVSTAAANGAAIDTSVSAGTYFGIMRYPSENGVFTQYGYNNELSWKYFTNQQVTDAVNTSTETLSWNEAGLLTSSGGFKGNLTGNASSATKLAASKSIGLSGDASGSASFNGSANATINATVSKVSGSGALTTESSVQEILNWLATITA